MGDPRVADADRALVECTGCCACVRALGDTYEDAEARAWARWDDRAGGSAAWVGPADDEDEDEWEGEDDAD